MEGMVSAGQVEWRQLWVFGGMYSPDGNSSLVAMAAGGPWRLVDRGVVAHTQALSF